MEVIGQEKEQKFGDAPDEFLGLWVGFDKTLHATVSAGLTLQPRLVVGVGEEAHVKNQVRVRGHAKAESKRHNRDQHGMSLLQASKTRADKVTQFVHIHPRC